MKKQLTAAQRADLISKLAAYRTTDMALRYGHGFRAVLNDFLGNAIYGGHVTNYRANVASVCAAIQRSAGVVELELAGLSTKEIGKNVVMEHVAELKDLRKMLHAEQYDQLIDAFEVVYVTKSEDALLRAAKKQGHDGAARYAAAGVVLV